MGQCPSSAEAPYLSKLTGKAAGKRCPDDLFPYQRYSA